MIFSWKSEKNTHQKINFSYLLTQDSPEKKFTPLTKVAFWIWRKFSLKKVSTETRFYCNFCSRIRFRSQIGLTAVQVGQSQFDSEIGFYGKNYNRNRSRLKLLLTIFCRKSEKKPNQKINYSYLHKIARKKNLRRSQKLPFGFGATFH